MNREIKDTWWNRNWKWAVPTIILVALVVFVSFTAAIVGFVLNMMKSSDVYQGALQIVRSDEAVQEVMGRPIEEGWYVLGNIDLQGGRYPLRDSHQIGQ